ncbi:YbhB/YbcL family Raf kinase inhibitor-like protein [Solimonas marina]|uniref:YbhB/YbcL family Raf kinase inhibitor-like protein n=1 Tax=Solimonas marina TaxID=2714601 RepID=A0A969W630_9GAMM|nr:YbhB/YbcL family Raf kinase inhibitor-like protein [Solimonas marina]NKF21102.1 YbhB/YbcL family Raf kinase inhibitor-like protein [Solimonas marina]
MHRATLFFAVCCAAAASSAHADGLTLSSPTLHDGGMLPITQVYDGFGCHGGNRSPALRWTAGPQGTKAYALTVYDPDAPTGSGWWHWVVIDLPAPVRELPAGAGIADTHLPAGARMLRNDFGTAAFGGACPPAGDPAHRYQFTLYALDAALSLPADASPALAGFMIHAHTLTSARLTVRYGR